MIDERFGIATGSYEDERVEWPRAVARARNEGRRQLELTAILPALLDTLADYLASNARDLEAFDRVSIHSPVGVASPTETVDVILALPVDCDVVFHPDLYGETDAVAKLGRRAVFENMDVAKAFGREVADLRPVFARFPEAGFCLDVAHVWTNDTSLALGHALLDTFGDRLRQLHVSGIEPDGTHRPTTQGDLELYRPLLDRCAGVPWLLEAVLV